MVTCSSPTALVWGSAGPIDMVFYFTPEPDDPTDSGFSLLLADAPRLAPDADDAPSGGLPRLCARRVAGGRAWARAGACSWLGFADGERCMAGGPRRGCGSCAGRAARSRGWRRSFRRGRCRRRPLVCPCWGGRRRSAWSCRRRGSCTAGASSGAMLSRPAG
jgi:hypothetical protein